MGKWKKKIGTFPDFSRLFPIIHDYSRLFTIIHDLLRLLQPQPATATSPKSKKQPKPSLSKMQQRLFFFYHTTKIFPENTSIYEPCKPANKMLKFYNYFRIENKPKKGPGIRSFLPPRFRKIQRTMIRPQALSVYH
jgi:hypothetical protein